MTYPRRRKAALTTALWVVQPMHETDPSVFPGAISDGETAGDLFGEAERPLTRRERAAVIARIQALVEFWGITEAELDADTPLVESPPPGPLPIKYQHPVTGETWDGQGPHPDWLRRALLKEGMRVEELRPPAPALTEASTSPPDGCDDGPPSSP